MNPSTPRIRLALKSAKETTPPSSSPSPSSRTPTPTPTPIPHPKIYLRFKLPEENTYDHDLAFYHTALLTTARTTPSAPAAIHHLLATQPDPVLAAFSIFKTYNTLFNDKTREHILEPLKEALVRARCTMQDRREFPALARAFFAFVGAQSVDERREMEMEMDVDMDTDMDTGMDAG